MEDIMFRTECQVRKDIRTTHSWPQVSSDVLVRKEKCLDKSEESLTDPWGWHGSSEYLLNEPQELNIAGVSLERQADDLEDFLQIGQIPLLQKGRISQLLQELSCGTERKAQSNLHTEEEFLIDILETDSSFELLSNQSQSSNEADMSSERDTNNLDHFTEDLWTIPSRLHIKPHELSDMGVRVVKENQLDEDSSWGEESTDSEFSLDSKAEHLDKYFSKQKYPHTSYSRHYVVRHLTINQSALKTLRSHLCMDKPPEKCVGSVNILLFGMKGAGKSSTINTFLSALDPDRRTINCVPTGQHPDSLTQQLTSYKSNSLKFWDTAGWNSLDDPVKTKKVLRMILEGRVPLGANLKDFNPDSDDAQNPVIPENVIHGVAFIFNTFTMDNVDVDLLKQFQDLQNVAQKSIYKIVIGTNFDRLRIPEKSYNYIYENKKLKRKFAKLSDYIGMKKHTMFVISNQWKGDKIEKTKCVLALYILKNMVRNIESLQSC
ncbi:uncharacterized protein LOC144508357 isoform X4 [Mustelus asterias]